MKQRWRISSVENTAALGTHPGARRRPGSVPFLLLAACGGMIAGSLPQVEPSPAKATGGAYVGNQPAFERRSAAPLLQGSPQADKGAADDRVVRVLANIVAKRYRVADDATRGLVAIAYREARRNRLDPLLVLAVIGVESRFNPIAESDGGALGLMQIVPKYHVQTMTASTRADMLDPQRNIGLGARVLKQYVIAGGTETAGLQKYNGAADDATNAYANRVMAEKQGLADSLRRVRERA
jgi:soluble lytic murein transglycosylase-like protein